MERYKVVRMNKDGSVGYDYGWGEKSWMMNMVYDEIECCSDGEYVKVEREDVDDDWDDEYDEDEMDKIVDELIERESKYVIENDMNSDIIDDYRLFKDYIRENYDIEDEDEIEDIWNYFLDELGERDLFVE